MDIIERLEERKRRRIKNERLRESVIDGRSAAPAVVFAALLMLVWAIVYVAKSRTVYFGEESVYWDICRNILNGKLSPGFWGNVYRSIGTHDYNYIAALPSAAWMRLFGISRMSYVIGLIVIYIIPSAAVAYHLAAKLSKAPRFAFFLSMFIMPITLLLAFSGIADVGGLLIALICYDLYYTRDATANEWYRYVIIGVLLVIISVFRKYFAFFSVSFMTMMIAESILMRKKIRNVLITFFSGFILLVTVCLPFFLSIVAKTGEFNKIGIKSFVPNDIKLITNCFGMIFIAFVFVMSVAGAVKKHELRPVFLWMQIILSAALLMFSARHEYEHMLLYIPAFMLIVIFFVNNITSPAALLGVCAVLTINILSVFFSASDVLDMTRSTEYAFVPSFSLRSQRRSDADAVLELRRRLDLAIPEGEYCGVLASSEAMNDELLRNAFVSLGEGEGRDSDYIYALPQIDSVDYAMLDEIYNANYVFVALPSQTHLPQGEQTIVDEGAASFESGLDIARSFEELSDFRCNINGIEFRLYRRFQNVDEKSRRDFEARLFY